MERFRLISGVRQSRENAGGCPVDRYWGRAAGQVDSSDGVILPAGRTGLAWEAGFEVIVPESPRGLVVEIENRGRSLCLPLWQGVPFDTVPPDRPATGNLGTGFLFRHGLGYARIQWQFGFADLPEDGQGAGFAILRDFGRALSAGQLNPRVAPVEHLYLVGSSQGGRFIKAFLREGVNVDPADPNRRVYDGMLPMVGGAGYLPINRVAVEQGIPPEADDPHGGDFPPFTWDAVLTRPTTDPKVIELFTTTEYYNRRGSLVTARPETFPDTLRHYDLAGANHLAVATFGSLDSLWPGITEEIIWAPADKGGWNCNGGRRMLVNQIDIAPYLRATLLNLVEWVEIGREPPPNAVHPLRPARPEELANPLPGVDLQVPAQDDLGNPVGGVRVADVEAPLGSYLPAWFAGENRGTRMFGGFQPLSREVLARRYPDGKSYLTAFSAAVDRLIAERHVLAEDREAMLARAAGEYERVAAGKVA